MTRARARSISSDLEELVASYIIASTNKNLHIYVDQPVSIGNGRVAYPDLVILDKDLSKVVAIADVKTDIGWNRNGIESMCKKLSTVREAIKANSLDLGTEPKLRKPFVVSEALDCHLIIGASVNSGKLLQSSEALEIATSFGVHLYILTEGKHPNNFSRQAGNTFIGMTVRCEDFNNLLINIDAV
jgi:hypothetical protein